jgi:hypothetical protein
MTKIYEAVLLTFDMLRHERCKEYKKKTVSMSVWADVPTLLFYDLLGLEWPINSCHKNVAE